MNKFQYCPDLANYNYLKTREVYIGDIPLGGSHPIRVQSMTNTNTSDTRATVNQIIKIVDAGADFVRMTARSVKEAENLKNIKTELRDKGYTVPLVADVHFNPKIAETAARIVEKVRINPGNYALKKSAQSDFGEIKKNFIRLIDICRENDTAIRIGVNHGSLSQRIMDQYGDTPEGMVFSALEFLEICNEQNFHKLVVSLKSSNTRVMVQANRLMVHEMLKKKMVYPLHLGVTEAGEGEEGRIKSAVGIGTLLTDGIGDTIRVSLTEAPEKEIPVAEKLIDHILRISKHEEVPEIKKSPIDPFHYNKRITHNLSFFNVQNPPVIAAYNKKFKKQNLNLNSLGNLKPDFILSPYIRDKKDSTNIPEIIPYNLWSISYKENTFPYFYSISQFLSNRKTSTLLNFIFVTIDDIEKLDKLKNKKNAVIILQALTNNPATEQRRLIFELINRNIKIPVVIQRQYNENSSEDLQIKASLETGPLFIDGLAEGIFIENRGNLQFQEVLNTAYGILQASRIRISRTEFISCPGCGRTQFELEKTTKEVRQKLGHLKGLKIAVMGCIVNGPGEMADADYGYVGSGPGKVSIYKDKEPVKKNIPQHKAIDELIELIKSNGDWKEP